MSWRHQEGVTWSPKRIRGAGLACCAGAALAALTPALAVAAPTAPGVSSVIVQESLGAGDGPERAVLSLGGRIERQLPLVHGFAAQLPTAALPALRLMPGVSAVTPNAPVRPQGYLPGSTYEQESTPMSMWNVTKLTGAQTFWARGYTGRGIDVAVIDTGVNRVTGLSATGKVFRGPDISFESQDPYRIHKDGYGHGTHMAGIVAGRDSTDPAVNRSSSSFTGMAPDARIVSVKVGDSNGVTDISQVIAAIDWVVQNRNINGFNMRVMLLAMGTDSLQHYTVSPLAHAVEQAWHKGITVVAAGGNGGKNLTADAHGLTLPATDPYVIAVGAQDHKGTVTHGDDGVAFFSSTGRGDWSLRNPDLIAPGVSIPSLRVAGSYIDRVSSASSKIGTRFQKGSGSSQAAAVVAGAAALVLSQHPEYNPNQVKAQISWYSTQNLTITEDIGSPASGNGKLDLAKGIDVVLPGIGDGWQRSYGAGSIDADRGTIKARLNGVAISGEKDIFGRPFNSSDWAVKAASGSSWTGSTWNGSTWTGSTWTGSTWTGSTWTGSTWTGSTWSGSTWSGSSWTGSTWASSTWSTAGWN